MPECQYCGNYESSIWRMAGFTCSNCRLNCPECGKDSKVNSNTVVVYDRVACFWCQGCGQLLPMELVTELEAPISDEDVQEVYDKYEADLLGKTWREADGVNGKVASGIPDDARYNRTDQDIPAINADAAKDPI